MKQVIGLAVLTVTLAYACSFGSAHADCIEYGDYLHVESVVNTPGSALGVAVEGSYAYVADGDSGFQVIDLSNPASPQIVGSVDTPGYTYDVAASGTYAYVADGYSGLQVVDVTNPASPTIVGNVGTPG